MIDRDRMVERALLAAALILSGSPLLAQDAGDTAERARQAYSSGPGAGTGVSQEQQAQAEQVAGAAAERLEVELLRTRVLEIQGRPMIVARVMEPGRASNTAFLVQTLVLDPASGEVLGVFSGTEAEIGALPELEERAPAADQPETTAE